MTFSHPYLHPSEESPGILRFGGARMALIDIQASFWGLRRQMEALVGPRLTRSVFQQAGTNGGASFAQALTREFDDGSGETAFRACVAAYQNGGFGQFEITELAWSVGHAEITAADTFEAWMLTQHNQESPLPACAYTAGVLVGFVNALSGRSDIVCIEHTCQAQGAEVCRFELLPASKAPEIAMVAFDPDPFISHQLGLLEVLFDRMPMGIAVIDRDYVLRRFNPTYAEYIDRYTPSSASDVRPGAGFFELVRDSEDFFIPLFERVLDGEIISLEASALESGGMVSYWDMVLSPLTENNEIVGIIDVSTDATARVQALQRLEEQVSIRTREMSKLLDLSHTITSTLEMEPLLGLILDQLKEVVDYTGATIFTLENDELAILAYRGPITAEEAEQIHLPLETARANREVILRQEPVIIPDVQGDSTLARYFQEAAGPELRTKFSYIRSWMGIPLTIRDRLIGMLTLDHAQTNHYTPQQAQLVLAFANQAAIAIENAQLYEQAKELAAFNERQRLARELHDAVTQTLFSASLIAEVLPRLWEKDPEAGRHRLSELRQLTRGALAEMRTLLLELRPSALTEFGLADLLRQLTEAINGRTRIPIVLELEGNCKLPPDVQVALYRIAQEALQNVAKHAGATRATVRMRCEAGRITIAVEDDGRGFDPESTPPGSLGLGIMRERAEAVGAELQITSAIDRGTGVTVTWTGTEEGEDS